MARSNRIVCALALAMIVCAAILLVKLHGRDPLGKPGVKTGVAPLLLSNNIVSCQSVLLPERVLDSQSTNFPVDALSVLPKDTTFGRRFYIFPDGTNILLTVVLMGSDRSSIHNPAGCMGAQSWLREKTERIMVPMDRPTHYTLPVNKFTLSNVQKDNSGQLHKVGGIYAYWFVSSDQITADRISGMMWSIAKALFENGVIERWAYISCFCPCAPGQEDAASKRVEQFIQAATPEFQLVAGPPGAGPL